MCTFQQPKIQNAFKKIYYEQVLSKDEILKELYENPKDITNKVMGLFPNSKGSQAYRTLADNVGGEKRMSELLNKAGIKGIKFKAGQLSGRQFAKPKETASENYVIFDDKLIKILEKYGIVGPVAVSATAAALRDDDGST